MPETSRLQTLNKCHCFLIQKQTVMARFWLKTAASHQVYIQITERVLERNLNSRPATLVIKSFPWSFPEPYTILDHNHLCLIQQKLLDY